MAVPKVKKSISIYKEKQLTERRQELLDRITKSDSFLPDAILHDDLDLGFLEYVKDTFKVISDGNMVPVIPKILTIQRWGEFTSNWEFSDDDGNVKLPFISVVRKPDVQFGTNPAVQRTIPDRTQFHYATVPTWDGNKMGANIYKIPQPIAVDISYDVTIVCTKFRDLNKMNKIVMEHFTSRQSYTTVKGHYIPIILNSIEDNSPIETIDGRRFYLQTYKFIMLGFLIDDDEFQVSPAISRMFVLNEFVESNNSFKKQLNKSIDITVTSFNSDGMQKQFSVGETMGILFYVSINGIIQIKDVDYFHISLTSKIKFADPPAEGSVVTIAYHKGKNTVFLDTKGKTIQVANEYFVYDGSSLTFTVSQVITDVVNLDINGLVEEDEFNVSDIKSITLTKTPVIGSKIGITYLYGDSYSQSHMSKIIAITLTSFNANGVDTQFSVDETIGVLFYVAINGLIQEKNVDYSHVELTSKVTFVEPPSPGSIVTIAYHGGNNCILLDTYGKMIQVTSEYFIYDGSSLTFTLSQSIADIVNLDINGLVDEDGFGFSISGPYEITLKLEPIIGSKIGITYLY